MPPTATNRQPLTPAQQQLVEDNRPLAYWIVRQYFARASKAVKQDLVLEALSALCESAQRYDPDNDAGAKFITYATRFIWGRCMTHIKRHVNGDKSKHGEVDRRPLAVRVPWSDEYAKDLATTEVVDEDGWENRERVAELLSRLPQRDQWMVRCLYGIGTGFGPMQRCQVAWLFGVSGERVRQIVERAVSRMAEMAGRRDEDAVGECGEPRVKAGRCRAASAVV